MEKGILKMQSDEELSDVSGENISNEGGGEEEEDESEEGEFF